MSRGRVARAATAVESLFAMERSGQLVIAGVEVAPKLASCPRCRSLVVALVNPDPCDGPAPAVLVWSDDGLVLDPPRHWVAMFWTALDDGLFWLLSHQDFEGSGNGGIHRCARRIGDGRDVSPSEN